MEKLRHRQRKWIALQSQCYCDSCSHLGLSPMRMETTLISVDFFHLCAAVTIPTDGLQQHSGSVIIDQCLLVLHKTNQKIWTKWDFLSQCLQWRLNCIALDGNCAWKGWICNYLAILTDFRIDHPFGLGGVFSNVEGVCCIPVNEPEEEHTGCDFLQNVQFPLRHEGARPTHVRADARACF